MERFSRHILIPMAAPVLFFVIAATPVEVLGCRTRGRMALIVSLISGFSALGAAIFGIKGRLRGESNTIWWIASTLVLTIPVIAMILLA
jgi:hypothetical protein